MCRGALSADLVLTSVMRMILTLLMTSRKKRRKLWQLPAGSLCSVLGSGLSVEKTRKLLRAAGVQNVSALSDYEVHKVAIEAGKSPGPAGKALHRALEQAHRKMVLRYQALWDAEALKAAWDEDCNEHLPSALWAVMTHGAVTEAIQQTVLSEAHMIGHRHRALPVEDASARAEIRSLKRRLAAAEEGLKEKTTWEETKQAFCQEKQVLLRRLEASEAERKKALNLLAQAQLALARQASRADEGLLAKLGRAERRIESLTAQLSARSSALPTRRPTSLEIEESPISTGRLTIIEEAPCDVCPDKSTCDLGGCTILYVGGERSMLPHLRRLAKAANAELIHHDGGREDKLKNLPRLCARADIVMFPQDRVGHAAVDHIKRACEQPEKAFVPLRRASIGAFEEGLFAAAS